MPNAGALSRLGSGARELRFDAPLIGQLFSKETAHDNRFASLIQISDRDHAI